MNEPIADTPYVQIGGRSSLPSILLFQLEHERFASDHY